MPLLPRRFERLKSVLNQRMADLTVLLEHVEKPHNLSAILRSCDAVGALEAHAVSVWMEGHAPSTAPRREARNGSHCATTPMSAPPSAI